MYFHLEITYKSVNTTPLNFPLLNQNPCIRIHIHIVVSDWKKIFANIRETNLSISSVIPKAKHDATDEEI